MVTDQTKKVGGITRNRRVKTTGIGKQRLSALATQNIAFRFESLATISTQYADGSVVAELPVGPYTYKAHQIAVTTTAQMDVPGVVGTSMTFEVNGVHYVKTQYLDLLVKKISLEIDGSVERDHTTGELVKLNAHYGYDTTDGFLWMTFGGPREFFNKEAEDAYMCGTMDLRDLRVNFELTAEWVTGSMFIQIVSEYARVQRPLAYLTTNKSFRYSFAAAGEHVITDVPINADLAQLFAFGTGIKALKLEVDGQFIFDSDYHSLTGLNALYGRDISALGDVALVDFWREQNPAKGLRKLQGDAQVRRNADIRIHLDLATAGTEIQIMARACGLYYGQG